MGIKWVLEFPILIQMDILWYHMARLEGVILCTIFKTYNVEIFEFFVMHATERIYGFKKPYNFCMQYIHVFVHIIHTFNLSMKSHR